VRLALAISNSIRRLSISLALAVCASAAAAALYLAPLTTAIAKVDEDLTLEGLRMLWELNA